MTQQLRNPFKHHHPHHDDGHDHHGHDHDHDSHEHQEEQLDPAQQSLADALRVSFLVLQVIMAVLAVFYLFSGFFTVPSNEAAVRLFFGRILGDPGRQVLDKGGPYAALPYPFMQVLHVPLKTQSLELNREFWWAPQPGDVTGMAQGKMGPLDPAADGSLITGDANIVHAKWLVTYKIDSDRVVDYIKNVNDPRLAEDLVSAATEEGVVFMVSHLTADEFLRAQVTEAGGTGDAVRHIQAQLDDLGTGIKIESLTLSKSMMPSPVKDAYDAVLNAENEKAKQIENAQQEHNKTMGETAGSAHAKLWQMIRDYEKVSLKGDPDEIAKADARLDTVFRNLNLGEENGNVPVSGKVAEIINEANNYRSAVVRTVQAEANAFSSFYDGFKTDPSRRRIVMSRLWQDAREKVFTSKQVESIYVPKAGLPYLDLSRDPAVKKAREIAGLRGNKPNPDDE